MEVGALQTALGSSGRLRPLQLGAAKSNVGHLEGGAGAGETWMLGDLDGWGWEVLQKKAGSPRNKYINDIYIYIYI